MACLEHFTKHPGCPLDVISKYAGVSPKTVKEYLKPLLAKFEEDKRSVIMRLNLLGWTQTEISDKLAAMWPDAKGTSQQNITNLLPEIGKFPLLVKTDLEKGHAQAELAKRYALPEILVWNAAGLAELESEKARRERAIRAGGSCTGWIPPMRKERLWQRGAVGWPTNAP